MLFFGAAAGSFVVKGAVGVVFCTFDCIVVPRADKPDLELGLGAPTFVLVAEAAVAVPLLAGLFSAELGLTVDFVVAAVGFRAPDDGGRIIFSFFFFYLLV